MTGKEPTFTIAVVNSRLTDAARLAQAVDRVSGRGDLIRPLRVLVNAAVAKAIATLPPGVAEVAGFTFVVPSDFRFVQTGGE